MNIYRYLRMLFSLGYVSVPLCCRSSVRRSPTVAKKDISLIKSNNVSSEKLEFLRYDIIRFNERFISQWK